MHRTAALITATFTALAQAGPVPNGPTGVLRREGEDPPEPSTYPLGDACTNEWQYLNFDPGNDADVTNLERLHDAICDGALRAISSYGGSSAEGNLPPFIRNFGDGDQDTQDTVSEVLYLISGNLGDYPIGPVVGNFVVDNLDFAKNNIPNDPNCDNTLEAGYTNIDPLDDREKFHFCQAAYDLPDVGNVDCGSLDSYPSEKIDAFQRIVLHEMMHHSLVGPATAAGQITDQQNNDDAVAYLPERTHGLVDPDQDDQPGKAENNADSYAWTAVDAWVSRYCSEDATGTKWANFFTEDPPNYEPEDEE